MTAVGLAQAAGGYIGGTTGPYIVLLAIRLDLAAADLGWIASAFGIALILVAVCGEWLLRLGAVRLLRGCAVVGAVGAVALAVAPDVRWAALGAGLTGLSGAVSVMATSTLLAGSAARMSLVTALASATGLLAPLVMGGLELLGAWGTLALLVPIAPLLVLAILPLRAAGAAAPHEPIVGTADGVALRPVLLAWTAIVLAVAAEFCFFIWGVARLVETGLSVALAAVLGVAFPLGMVIGRTLGARMRPAPAAVTRRRLQWAAVVTATATVAVVLGPGVVGVALGLTLAGLGMSVAYPLSYSLLVSVPGLMLRRAAAVGASASGLGILAAPVALAALAQVVELRWAFLLPLPLLGLLVLVTRPVAEPAALSSPAAGPAALPVPAPRSVQKSMPASVPESVSVGTSRAR